MMKRSGTETLSRHLAFLLRHSPTFVDKQGWVSFEAVTTALAAKAGGPVTVAEVKSIVKEDSKGRYEISDGRVRAVQGHSFEVDLGLSAEEPPVLLFHGTVDRFVSSILGSGLRPQSRTHVHLSESLETAVQVGSRRSGETIILTVEAARAHKAGVEFFRSTNGVWLARSVPAEYISR